MVVQDALKGLKYLHEHEKKISKYYTNVCLVANNMFVFYPLSPQRR